jgi:parallel beta-helix repeat protein
MTVSQRRGFDLFRSGKARCFECHQLPTFASPDFKVIGVPALAGDAADRGRLDVSGEERLRGAFKVPTLRNVALTAPYMHNGRFATLDEVVDFYAKGGGPGAGVETKNLDDKIRPFALTARERTDLVNFLVALTDESALAASPYAVPSTLRMVSRMPQPRRSEIRAINSGEPSRRAARETNLTVRAGGSIQAAVDRAAEGATIRVLPGVYQETVTIDVDGIQLIGESADDPKAEIRRPVLDGGGALSDAVIATGRNFTMDNFDVRGFTGNGVVAQETSRTLLQNLHLADTGLYGVYPVRAEFVTIRRVTVTGARDAGIYVGQSKGIVVEECVAHGNVTGIEIENSVDARVENNHVYDNAGGILVFALPGNPSKEAKRTRVARNRVIGNNHRNFADPAAVVAKVPSGGGIFILAADDTEVTENEIRNNKSFGVAVLGLESLFPGQGPFDVGAFSDRTRVHGNTWENNGYDADPSIVAAGLKGADLLWDLTGPTNVWNEPRATTAVPVLDERLPPFLRRAVYQGLVRLK